jgi:hypothetical protein
VNLEDTYERNLYIGNSCSVESSPVSTDNKGGDYTNKNKNLNNGREELEMRGITDLNEREVKRKELVKPNTEVLVCPAERVPCS